MKNIIIIAIILFFAYKIFSSNSEERYNVGFKDGYAVGYNTECKIRATRVEGDWGDDDYSLGYNQGKHEGIKDCRKSR